MIVHMTPICQDYLTYSNYDSVTKRFITHFSPWFCALSLYYSYSLTATQYLSAPAVVLGSHIRILALANLPGCIGRYVLILSLLGWTICVILLVWIVQCQYNLRCSKLRYFLQLASILIYLRIYLLIHLAILFFLLSFSLYYLTLADSLLPRPLCALQVSASPSWLWVRPTLPLPTLLWSCPWRGSSPPWPHTHS